MRKGGDMEAIGGEASRYPVYYCYLLLYYDLPFRMKCLFLLNKFPPKSAIVQCYLYMIFSPFYAFFCCRDLYTGATYCLKKT